LELKPLKRFVPQHICFMFGERVFVQTVGYS